MAIECGTESNLPRLSIVPTIHQPCYSLFQGSHGPCSSPVIGPTIDRKQIPMDGDALNLSCTTTAPPRETNKWSRDRGSRNNLVFWSSPSGAKNCHYCPRFYKKKVLINLHPTIQSREGLQTTAQSVRGNFGHRVTSSVVPPSRPQHIGMLFSWISQI